MAEEFIDNILILVDGLYEEFLNAGLYWSFIKQFCDNIEKYNDEINCSPIFYSTVYSACVKSLFMELAKIYDESSRDNKKEVLSIYKLIDYLSENECNDIFEHTLSAKEKCFYKEIVEETKRISEKLGIDNLAARVEISYSEYINILKKRIHSEKRRIDNIKMQRNKRYAHNAAEFKFDYESISKRWLVVEDDIDALLDLAFDIIQFASCHFGKLYKSKSDAFCCDWETTLALVQESKINDSKML